MLRLALIRWQLAVVCLLVAQQLQQGITLSLSVVRQQQWVMLQLHTVFHLLLLGNIQLRLVNLQLHLVKVLLRLVVRMRMKIIKRILILLLMAPMRLRLVQKHVQVRIMQSLLLVHRWQVVQTALQLV